MWLPNQLGVIDVLIIALLSIGLAVGAYQGVVRQLLFLAAVYFGMVLAAQYYPVAGTLLAYAFPDSETRARSTVGLLLVFVVAVFAINAVGYAAYKSTRLTAFIAADRAGGAALGLLSSWLFISLLLTVADFGLAMPFTGYEWAQRDAAELLRTSAIVPMIHHSMPALYETLRPWLPIGLPAPFAA